MDNKNANPPAPELLTHRPKKAEKEDAAFCNQQFMVCVAVLVLATALAAWVMWLQREDEDDLKNVVHNAMWTVNSLGNPKTYQIAAVRSSPTSPNIICGRINYERSNNRGWSGYTNFFLERGVMYISPSGGVYEDNFNFYCLSAQRLPGLAHPE